MRRVYVAGPYNAANVIDMLGNIRRGTQKAVEILKAGYAPFCPWLDYSFSFYDRIEIEEYWNYSLAWLEVSDCIYLLPNSADSKGVRAELKRAFELKIPVVHTIEELNELFKGDK